MIAKFPDFKVARRDMFGKKAATQGTVWLRADPHNPDVFVKPQTLSTYFGKTLSARECRSLMLANQRALNTVIAQTNPTQRAKAQGKRMVAEVTLADLTAADVKLSDRVLCEEWPYMF